MVFGSIIVDVGYYFSHLLTQIGEIDLMGLMSMIPNLFAGLVVPDVPLEETESLRKEAIKHNIELVCLLIDIIFLVF